jgi:hypothetical protein
VKALPLVKAGMASLGLLFAVPAGLPALGALSDYFFLRNNSDSTNSLSSFDKLFLSTMNPFIITISFIGF